MSEVKIFELSGCEKCGKPTVTPKAYQCGGCIIDFWRRDKLSTLKLFNDGVIDVESKDRFISMADNGISRTKSLMAK